METFKDISRLNDSVGLNNAVNLLTFGAIDTLKSVNTIAFS